MKPKTHGLVLAALIAALYTGLTYLMAFFGLAYGPVQFRVSEALCILPVFTPYAVAGLTAGCFISNIMSFNALDMIFGTLATLAAALLTRALRRIKVGGVPVLSLLMPVIINGAVVGAEIALFWSDGKGSFMTFLITAFWVAVGEAAVCFGAGLPLYFAVRKNKILSDFMS